MGTRQRNAILILMAFVGAASGNVAPVPKTSRPPVLMAIPAANLLSHGQYQAAGRFQYFTSSEFGSTDSIATDTVEVQSLNYTSELIFGFENRAEVGMQYGKELSFSLKALLLREDLFWPDVVFGVRNLFGSQEGTLYGLSEGKTLRSLRGESYATVAKSFATRSRLHLGMSISNGANKGLASFNGAWEQDLGGGAYFGYEIFERFSDFHQVLSLHWNYRGLIGLSLGMTEFQSWIRQDGRWGFFLTPEKSLKDGYNSPGLTFALQFRGWVPHRQKRTLPERVALLEVEKSELEKRVERAELRVAKLQRVQDSLRTSPPARGMVPVAPAAKLPPLLESLKALADKLGSDLADPQDIRESMGRIVAMGPEAADNLKRLAADSGAADLRVPAVLVMAYSRDTAYVTPLRDLCGDKDARVRREALTALVKLSGRSAQEDARKLLSDPDEAVALSAADAYRQLGGKPENAGGVARKGKTPAGKAAKK